MHAFEIVVLVLVTLGTRLPFLLVASPDRATQHWIIKAFSRSRRIAGFQFPGSFRQGRVAYPPLPHYLIALLPERFWPAISVAIVFAAEVVHVLIVYSMLLGGISQQSLALPLALLFATLPILHPVNARLVSAGARTLGPLAVTAYFLCLGNVVLAGQPGWLVATVPLAVLIVLSSQFALQVLVGFSVVASVWLLSPWPLVSLILGLVGSLLTPGLDVPGQLRTKLQHYAWYWRAKNLHVGYRNSPAEVARLITGRLPGLGRLAIYCLTSTTPGVVLAGTGTIYALAWFGLKGAGPSSADSYALVFSGAGLICMLLTVAGPLRIFGEAERYVEYAAPWMVIAAAALTLATPEQVLVLVLVNVVLSLFNFILMNLDELKRRFAWRAAGELADLVAYIDEAPGRRIVTSPLMLGSELSLYSRGQHRFLHILIADRDEGLDHWTVDLAGYPHLRGDSRWFAEKYGADTVILDKGTLKSFKALSPEQDMLDLPVLFENSRYLVLKLEQPAHGV